MEYSTVAWKGPSGRVTLWRDASSPESSGCYSISPLPAHKRVAWGGSVSYSQAILLRVVLQVCCNSWNLSGCYRSLFLLWTRSRPVAVCRVLHQLQILTTENLGLFIDPRVLPLMAHGSTRDPTMGPSWGYVIRYGAVALAWSNRTLPRGSKRTKKARWISWSLSLIIY